MEGGVVGQGNLIESKLDSHLRTNRPTVNSWCDEKVGFAVLDQKSESVREGPDSSSATREMAALHSGDKKRVLPSWMTAQGPEERMWPVKTPKRKRRRMAAVPAAAARLPAVRTVYCMSEAELVDVALGVLIENRQQGKALKQRPLAGTAEPELSPTCSEGPASPETSEGEDSGEAALPPGQGRPQGSAGLEPACSSSPEEDEDAFKYVREIFFS
ncbi:cell cycle regulator of non-homologous end joining isoform X1 [Myotis yumanensis]|uniref:cell cycle regulator of non-homologous end joining isoform X1 n=2 Tax=Myotis yumanensis TaxID=159337 RepID=UPI0038D12B0D